jgi:prophage tail gpP-like protein
VRKLEHKVTLSVGIYSIEGWLTYDILNDMMSPADAFSMSVGPVTPELWRALERDAEVQVFLDDTRILSGFLDRRQGSSSKQSGSQVSISGRDRGGRLLDERMPLIGFAGLGIADLAKLCAGPWVESVALSNATNRRLVAGKGAKMGRISAEPAIDVRPRTEGEKPRKVRPGETRWQVLSQFLEEGKLLAWLSADGKTLVVGQPNYSQEPTFQFFHAAPGSRRGGDSNVESFEVSDDVSERYSRIICIADSTDTDGETIRCKGETSNGPGVDGIGKDFTHPKVMIVTDSDVRTNRMATVRAEREMAERDSAGHEVRIVVKGHGQLVAGAQRPTLYAFDTMARVESEDFEIKGDYLITSTRFTMSKDAGPVTELRLVPKGTVLSS